MVSFNEMVKKIAIFHTLDRALNNIYINCRLRSKSNEEIFTHIFKHNIWGGKESVSGRGSDSDQTGILIEELQSVLSYPDISTMLDIPCGDFHWMSNVNLDNIDYMGADIVAELVEQNIKHYQRSGVNFQKLNIISDALPKADLVFTRDCLVHLSFQDIFASLNNVCDSGSKYFLTTTYPERTKNHDIHTGSWRCLNLECAPFKLPEPIKRINEGCTETCGVYADKALGLWRVADIRERLACNEN